MSNSNQEQYEYLIKKRHEVEHLYQDHFDILGIDRWKLYFIDRDLVHSRDDRFIFIRIKLSSEK
jgi:hypothetical protein